MRVQLARWGDGAGLQVPNGMLEQLGRRAGSQVDLVVAAGIIELRPVRRTSRQVLDDTVAAARRLGAAYEPESLDRGPDRGSEIIDDADPR